MSSRSDSGKILTIDPEPRMYAQPRTWFSKDWTIRSDDGRDLLLDLATWREGAELELDGESYSLDKKGLLGGEFSLRREGQLVARAEKPSHLRNRFEIEFGAERCSLEKASFFSRGFQVRRGDQVVGSIRPLGLFTRRTEIDLPEKWPVAVRLFVFWLAVVIWNRQAAAAASS